MSKLVNQVNRNEDGYVLMGVLVLLALSLLVSMGMLDSSATNAKTRSLVTTQADYYYEVEETLNKVVGWLQTNSKSIVTAFSAANFNSNFDLGTPSLGTNEGEHFGVPTMVKMAGTNNSVMLSNNSFFGTATFPATTHIDTNAAFDAVSSFANADLGGANARVILIWARQTDANFEPVFRIDVVTGNNPDRGVHSFSYVYTTLDASGAAIGFYGQNFLDTNTGNNECYSFQYTNVAGVWSKGAPRSNCPIASDLAMSIKSKIHGTGATLQNNGITLRAPGGDISGATCEGAGCHGFSLPVYNDWATYCPVHNGDLSISSDTTLAAGGCWRDIGIDNHKTLTLSDWNNPYYIRTLDFRANFAKFDIGTVPVGEKVTIYVEKISNDHINGNLFYNPNNAPHQLEIRYIGTDPLQLNGTSGINMFLLAPKIDVVLNGNFDFYGGIHALSMDVIGKATFNYDEGIGATPTLSDMNFALKKTSQRYR